MKVEALYIPPLSSESDTQFFSKEFTDTEILNPEEAHGVKSEQHKCDELQQDLTEGDLECLYHVRTADEAENNFAFDNFC